MDHLQAFVSVFKTTETQCVHGSPSCKLECTAILVDFISSIHLARPPPFYTPRASHFHNIVWPMYAESYLPAARLSALIFASFNAIPQKPVLLHVG